MKLHHIAVDQLPPPGTALPKKVVPFIWHFVGQVKPQLFFLALMMGCSHLLDALQYYFVKLFIDAFGKSHDLHTLLHILRWTIFSYVALMMIIQPLFARSGQWLMARLKPAFTNLMRRQLALTMHRHSYGYFQNDFAGRLASKVIETPTAIATIVQIIVNAAGRALIIFGVALTLFSRTYWVFSVMVLIWAALYALLLKLYIPRILKSSKNSYDQQSIIRGRFVDTLTNIMTVKLFARARHEDEYLVESLQNQTDKNQRMMLTISGMNVWLEVISVFFVAAGFGVALVGWSHGKITAGDTAMVLPMVVQLMNMSWWMSDVITSLFESFGQVQEGMQTITVAHAVEDLPDAPALQITKGEIAFRGMQFSYGDNKVFENFNLIIPPGQKVGLLGPSGAGKSTLVQLLLRFYDAQSGVIEIDGQSIAAVQQESLREQIAVIPQSADLLHRSIRDNVAYGRLGATDAEIHDAAMRAHATEFIESLVDQQGRTAYETLVGERGVKLSGGQRQRIAIARAILKDAPVLVLDEATSALDSESEKLIQSSLQGLMQGKTVLAIAHRLSTIAHMDRLIVLDKGRIVEDGSHAELLERNGLYARLWAMQSSGFIIAK